MPKVEKKPMRLAHKILSQPCSGTHPAELLLPIVELTRERLPYIPTIIADDIVEHVSQDPEKTWDHDKDWHNIAPVFPEFFVEWFWPPSSAISQWAPAGLSPAQTGWMFAATEIESAKKSLAERGTEGLDIEFIRRGFEGEDAKWVIVGGLWTATHADMSPICTGERIMLTVSSEGKLLSYGVGKGSILEEHPDSLLYLCGFALMTIAMMHCKNITLVDADTMDGVPRQKWLDRQRLPSVKYSKLVIDPAHTLTRKTSLSAEEAADKARHLVRGFFRTYAPDGGGLFGRGQTGTFWIPAHERGNEKAGRIIHDYQVKPDTREPASV